MPAGAVLPYPGQSSLGRPFGKGRGILPVGWAERGDDHRRLQRCPGRASPKRLSEPGLDSAGTLLPGFLGSGAPARIELYLGGLAAGAACGVKTDRMREQLWQSASANCTESLN